MALPLVLSASAVAGHATHHHIASAGLVPGTLDVGLMATGIHTAGYLAVTMLLAVAVYERLGLRVLRTAWVNLDLVWGVALIGTGVLTAVG
jgi:hypothetical protein